MRGTSNHEGGPDGFRLSPAPRGRTQTATTELRHSDWTDYRGLVIVFGRTAADPFVPSTIRNRALAAWEAADLRPIALHECRHSFASMLIDAGGNAKALQDALGHASIQMTWDKYGHLMPGGRDELRVRLDSYLSARLSGAAKAASVY